MADKQRRNHYATAKTSLSPIPCRAAAGALRAAPVPEQTDPAAPISRRGKRALREALRRQEVPPWIISPKG